MAAVLQHNAQLQYSFGIMLERLVLALLALCVPPWSRAAHQDTALSHPADAPFLCVTNPDTALKERLRIGASLDAVLEAGGGNSMQVRYFHELWLLHLAFLFHRRSGGYPRASSVLSCFVAQI